MTKSSGDRDSIVMKRRNRLRVRTFAQPESVRLSSGNIDKLARIPAESIFARDQEWAAIELLDL
jgi:hypothetical protein